MVDGRAGARTLAGPDAERLKGKRDGAILGILLACGLRRHEVAALSVDHLQQREGHWAIVNLSGKAGHVRTLPVPDWGLQPTERVDNGRGCPNTEGFPSSE